MYSDTTLGELATVSVLVAAAEPADVASATLSTLGDASPRR
jgi:hypothetical protein